MFQTDLLVNGKFTPGQGAEETVLNPATGQPLVKVREASVEQVGQAVAGAGQCLDRRTRRRLLGAQLVPVRPAGAGVGRLGEAQLAGPRLGSWRLVRHRRRT